MIPQETINRIHSILVRIKGFIIAIRHDSRLLKSVAVVNLIYIIIATLIYQSADISTRFEAFRRPIREFCIPGRSIGTI